MVIAIIVVLVGIIAFQWNEIRLMDRVLDKFRAVNNRLGEAINPEIPQHSVAAILATGNAEQIEQAILYHSVPKAVQCAKCGDHYISPQSRELCQNCLDARKIAWDHEWREYHGKLREAGNDGLTARQWAQPKV